MLVAALAETVGAMTFTTRMPTRPVAAPMTPPIRPCTSDSPATCRVMRPFDQPMALRVPNSRVRRVTPEMVNRMAMRNAAARTTIDSHRPRFDTRVDAVAREPETLEARSDSVETVALDSSFCSAVLIVATSEDDSAET